MRRASGVRGAACLAALAVSLTPGVLTTLPAAADTTDGTITVLIARDVDGDGSYDPEVDQPQSGVEVTVTDAGDRSVSDTTDDAGQVVVEPSGVLSGGRYFVTAQIPEDLGLEALPGTGGFAPLSSTVDVTSEDQVVRVGLTARAEPDPTPTAPPPEPPPSAAASTPAAPRFAVGDRVWRDLDRNGRQDAGEPGAPRTSVQILDRDGTVVDTTTTDADGRYRFDGLAAGTYSVRFAGIPAGSKLSPSGVGGSADDSDPDFTGATPPFTLDVGQPGVRRASAGDRVRAQYVDLDVDAGIAALTYAVGSVVWQDANGDGLLDPDEPAARARVGLLDRRGDQVASVSTDDQGRFVFDDLPAGSYRLRFSDLGQHRQLTVRRAGANPATSSAADPRTGTTDPFTVGQGAPDMIPASDFGDVRADFVKAAVNVGTVGSYSIANRVWRDSDGDGVLGRDEPGVRGVRVELLDARDAVVAETTTDADGRYAFDRLAAGRYRLKFPHLPRGLFFTAPGVGEDPTRDSDVYGNAVTAAITVGEENPVENQLAVGLTTTPVAAASPSSAAPAAGVAVAPVAGSVPRAAGTAAAVSLGVGLLAAAGGLTVYLRRRARRVRGLSS